MANLKPHQKESFIKKSLGEKPTRDSLSKDECFVLSFKHLDKTQGDVFHDWESTGMLAQTFDKLSGFCHKPLRQQVVGDTFKIYGGFPPKEKTTFSHPKHVPEDAEWARIHINGKHVVAGHIIHNTFYVVFLDSKHEFWISELKNT